MLIHPCQYPILIFILTVSYHVKERLFPPTAQAIHPVVLWSGSVFCNASKFTSPSTERQGEHTLDQHTHTHTHTHFHKVPPPHTHTHTHTHIHKLPPPHSNTYIYTHTHTHTHKAYSGCVHPSGDWWAVVQSPHCANIAILPLAISN